MSSPSLDVIVPEKMKVSSVVKSLESVPQPLPRWLAEVAAGLLKVATPLSRHPPSQLGEPVGSSDQRLVSIVSAPAVEGRGEKMLAVRGAESEKIHLDFTEASPINKSLR